MGRVLAGALLLAAIAVPGGARAAEPIGEPIEVTFEALPCAAACTHWIEAVGCDDPKYCATFYIQVCDEPFASDGYDDVEITVPEGARALRFESTPVVSWDTFICAPDGEELAIGADCAPLAWWCDPPWVERVPIGAPESMTIAVRPGQRLILRAYNWLDPFPLRGTYTFYGG